MPSNNPVGSLTTFIADIDDWCGTRPPRKFPPRPGVLRDKMIAVAIHRLSEQVGNTKLKGALQKIAIDLYQSAAG